MNPEVLGVLNSTLSAVKYGVLRIHCFSHDTYTISGRYFNIGNSQCSFTKTIQPGEYEEIALPAPGEYTIINNTKHDAGPNNRVNIDRVVSLNSGEYKEVDARLSTNCWKGVKAIIDSHFEKKIPIGKSEVFPQIEIPADKVSPSTTGFVSALTFDVIAYTIDNIPHYPHAIAFGFVQPVTGVPTISANKSYGDFKKPKGDGTTAAKTGVIYDPSVTSIVGWLYKEEDKYDGTSKTTKLTMPWTWSQGINPNPETPHYNQLTPMTYIYHNLPDDLKEIITPRMFATSPGAKMTIPYVSIMWGAKSMIESVDDASTSRFTSGKPNVIEQSEPHRFGLPLWLPRTYEVGRYISDASIREYIDARPFQYFEQDYSHAKDYAVMIDRSSGEPMCWWTGSPSKTNSTGFAYIPKTGLSKMTKALTQNAIMNVSKSANYGYLPCFLVAAEDSEY